MENTLEFQQDAIVVVSNGDEIGHISRVVMRPETKEVTHIVVRMKSLLKKVEKLIPVSQITATTEGQIVLSSAVEDLESLVPFEEEDLIQVEGSTPGISPPSQSPSAFGTTINLPAYMPPSGEKFITRIKQNIPEGTVAVEEGAKVITEEGKYVGKLERIVTELPEDQATHLLISKGFIAEEKRLIPIGWVQRMGEKEIHLGVKEETVDELAGISSDQN
jgi:uncharacterized protein YrrD